MQIINRRVSRRFALILATALVGLMGLSLSVVAFGQDTSTAPLSDYTTTVPTATTPPATTPSTPAPKPKPKPQAQTQDESASSAPAPAPATATAAAPKTLAFTGFDVLPLLLVGAAFAGLGATLLVRRTRQQ